MPLDRKVERRRGKSCPSFAGKALVIDVVDERGRHAVRRVPARDHDPAGRVAADTHPGTPVIEQDEEEAGPGDDHGHVIAQPPDIFLGGGWPFDTALGQFDRDGQSFLRAQPARGREEDFVALLHRARILFGRAVAAGKDV